MLYFSKVKTAIIWAICAAGILLSLPNLLPAGALSFMPRFTLGLDLRGGSYLLLEADSDALVKDRMESLADGVRSTLREAGIVYRDMTVAGRTVSLGVGDPARLDEARRLIEPLTLADAPGTRDASLSESGGRLTLTLEEAGVTRALTQAIEQAVEIVRRRIDETGVNEPVVARQGSARILVQLPGLDDPGRIKRLLGQTAKMTFHLLSDDPNAPGTRMLPSQDSARGEGRIAIRTRVEMDGARLSGASAGNNPQTGEWVVNFSLDGAGARRFADITTKNVGKPFAIVLDGKVLSAPVIREPITGGRGQISGSFTAQSAHDLAVLLRAGALPVPLTVVEERTVGPDLGADAIQAGLMACLVGFVLVVGYMGASYGLFGIFANIALVFNLALTLACLSLLGAALTLPGIAGILLTLGMSVDANILINERIREETRRGMTPVAAMEAGFRRAFATITDSNLTTLIKMAILYIVGTGTVKGFAVTISLGIITSMFTATVVARWLMVAWYRRRKPKDLPQARLRLVPDVTRIKFMRGRNLGLGMSVALSLASVVLFFTPGLNYGVDFAGGTVMEIRTPQAANFSSLRDDLSGLNLGQIQLQQFGAPTDVLIRFETQPGGDSAQQAAVKAVHDTLDKTLPGTSVRRVETVGASVSAELFQGGMIALGLAAVAMLVYITFRFEWQFGVGAVVTMFLDVTKTIGFFALTGMQFNLVAIAAILTIMGYSINDKVVVYDRVRENLRRYKTMPLRELIDLSINETMTRTVNTSLALFLATLPLALFGGEALQEFALVLLFGVVLATSSSIFIAAPILLYLGENRLRRSPVAEDPEEAATAP